MKILIREHTGTHGNLREPNLAWWRITPSFPNYVTTTVNEPAHVRCPAADARAANEICRHMLHVGVEPIITTGSSASASEA